MRELLIDPLRAGYMRRAIIEIVMLGVLGGVVGVHVLLRRLSFLTEVVQHTVFPGIAIAFAFGQSLLVGALTTGLASVVLLTMLGRTRRIDADSAMAVLFAVFLAVGGVTRPRRRGFQSDLTALFFGRILAVDARQLVDTIVVAALCLIVLAVLHKELVLGLSPREMVLLVMTILVSMLTFGTGRTNILFGLVHLVVFAVFLFLVFVP